MVRAAEDARPGRASLRPNRAHKEQRVLCIGRRVECFGCGGSGLARYHGLCGACGGLGTRLVLEAERRRP